MYNIDKILKELNLKPHIIEKIKSEAKTEFVNDPMMYELHILRIAAAIKKGHYDVTGFDEHQDKNLSV